MKKKKLPVPKLCVCCETRAKSNYSECNHWNKNTNFTQIVLLGILTASSKHPVVISSSCCVEICRVEGEVFPSNNLFPRIVLECLRLFSCPSKIFQCLVPKCLPLTVVASQVSTVCWSVLTVWALCLLWDLPNFCYYIVFCEHPVIHCLFPRLITLSVISLCLCQRLQIADLNQGSNMHDKHSLPFLGLQIMTMTSAVISASACDCNYSKSIE